MATYEPEDGRSGIRSRAMLVAGGLIAATGIAALVGSTIRDDSVSVARSTAPLAAPEITAATPPESTVAPTLPPTTLAPEPLPCPKPLGETQTKVFPMEPPICIDMAAKYRAKVRTDKGTIWIALDQNAAPKTVNNFVYLARYGFYDGMPFHRVIGDYLIQTGSPDATGEAGPGYAIQAEPGAEALKPGSVVMADRANGSQFFIVSGASGAGLNPADFNPIGVVSQGLDVVTKINALAVPDSEVSSQLVTIKSLEIVAEGEGGPAAAGTSTGAEASTTTTAPAA
jgi:cyclophilin family peptidyl-prolyl cis-trans isomerase